MNIINKIWKEYQLTKVRRLDPALEIALNEYGTKEGDGAANNPEVMKYFHEAGFSEVAADEVSWCAAFVNWCQLKAGRNGTASLAARSFLQWGEKVTDPQLGDIAVFWRTNPASWQGHVGFFIKRDGTNVWVLGGNQSNQVNILPYAGNQLLGYRRAKD